MNCFYNRVQSDVTKKKNFFFFFFYISAFWIPPGIPYRCSMMKSINRPLGGDRFVEARDMAAWIPNYAGFRLTCRLPHCRFDDDICSTAQAPLAAEGWPSGKQRQANRSIILPLCPPRQIADSWILCNSGAMPLGDKAKAALPLRAATLKQQAMITRHSSNAAS